MNATADKTTALEMKFTTSRARDTEGYTICTLYADGQKVARTCGGGYDMQGTVLGDYIAREYADRLLQLKAEDMPPQSHWQPAQDRPIRECECLDCKHEWRAEVKAGENQNISGEATNWCPLCNRKNVKSGPIFQGRMGWNDGKTIYDGRYFYGLTFHDPNYDPSKAVIGTDCNDRTLGPGAEGKTVEQAEADGESFGLERYQAFYTASSKTPTERHTVPMIDGGCGIESVRKIAEAIGLTLEYVVTRGKNRQEYILHDNR